MKTGILVAIVSLGATCQAIVAQQVHLLSEERVVEGSAKIGRDQVVVTTVFGEWTLRAADYVGPGQVDAAQLVRDYETRAKEVGDDVDAHRKLAAWCLDNGCYTGLRKQLNEILLRDIDDPWARNVLKEIGRTHVVHPAERGRRGRDRRNLARFLFDVLARRDFAGAVLAVEKGLELPREINYGYGLDALKHEHPAVRWSGARIVAAHRDKSTRINPLYRHALLDKALAVRRECVRSLRVTEDPVFTRLFSRNLGHGHSGVRANAAEALAEYGDAAAIPALIRALADGAGAPRNHVAVRTQRAYVKDFDVEIAQAAVIADPVVDVVTEGTVLDVRVVSVNEELATYRGALRRLSGVDFGTDAAAWKSWWQSRG